MDEARPPTELGELDPNFKYEVAEYPGAENIRLCFACGTCSAGCPVREIDQTFNPRQIIRMVLLGMRERVLRSDFIWICSTCYTCHERCPQGVGFTDIMKALENMAVKAGYIKPLYRELMKLLSKTGTIYPADNRRRERMGLPPVPAENVYANKVFELTGVKRLLSGEEGESR